MKLFLLDDCFPILLMDDKVIRLVQDEVPGGVEEVLALIEQSRSASSSKLDLFHEALLQLLNEYGECIDEVEIEFLTSYSETTTFTLRQFGGVFWVENFECGDTGYFLTAEDATSAAGNEHGFDWKNPENSPFIESPVSTLIPDEE
jgi:hypothetical protein